MWRALFACLVLVLPATGALAAERVLLVPNGTVSAVPSAAATAGFKALRTAAADQGNMKVIVGLRVPFAPEGALTPAEAREQRAEIATATSSIRSSFASAVKRSPKAFHSFNSVPFVALEVTPEELERLAADPNVISIAENRVRKPSMLQSLPMVQGNQAHAAGFTGTGQTIAIIDTGVDKNHPFLGGRVVSEACYSTTSTTTSSLCPGGVASSTAAGSGMPCTSSLEGCDHGTHVAGIAAGSSSGMQGVARGANIISIQVFTRYGNEIGALDSDIIAALERVHHLSVSNQFTIAAVNMSLGSGRYRTTCDRDESAYVAVIGNLRNAGIATVVATGNDGYSNSMQSPACVSNAVSVGSVSVSNWGTCSRDLGPTARDKVACYSNAASFLTLLAPGSPVSSSVLGNQYGAKHGTSMAAPHVAGAFALLKQKRRDVTVEQALNALRQTGTPVTDYRNPAIVTPRINIMAALNSLPEMQPRLTYSQQGTGAGSVTFKPVGSVVSCTASCNNNFPLRTRVRLQPAAAEGSVFRGWSGACSGMRRCLVTMTEARAVTATFDLLPRFTLTYDAQGTGTGTVSFSRPTGVAPCTGDCTNPFAVGTRVTLTARAGANSTFSGWGGACKGKRSCRVTMSQVRTVSATFTATTPRTTIGALVQP
jgi:subtilisin family serine protease